MAVSISLLCFVLPFLLIGSVKSECIYYNYYNYIYSSYYHCYYEIPVRTIIGAVIGGIGALIVLCVIVTVVCVVVCKKKTTAYNPYPTYPQQHGWGVQQQGWGVHLNSPAYPGHGQQPSSVPVSQPMPPPTYAENVIQGQKPQTSN